MANLTQLQTEAAERICARFPQISRKEFRGDITLTIPPSILTEAMAYAKEACAEAMPEFKEVEKGHFVACHFTEEIN